MAKKEKSSPTPVDQRRSSVVEIDGQRQARRQENRQGVEAYVRRDECDGNKAWDIVKHSRLGGYSFGAASTSIRSGRCIPAPRRTLRGGHDGPIALEVLRRA